MADPTQQKRRLLTKKQNLYRLTSVIAAHREQVIEMRHEGKTVFELAFKVFGNDLPVSMTAMERFVEGLPSRRLSRRYG
jgi:hypothetical protein